MGCFQKKKNFPIGVLKKRFASGEITKENYQDQQALFEKICQNKITNN